MSEPSGSPSGETEVSRMAGWTGLEPAASGVTGRRSNQLNYHPKRARSACALTRFGGTASAGVGWYWAVQGSNLRQPACKAGALPLS